MTSTAAASSVMSSAANLSFDARVASSDLVASGSSGVAELVTEQLRHVVDKPPRLSLGQFGKLVAPDLTGLATDPPYGLRVSG